LISVRKLEASDHQLLKTWADTITATAFMNWTSEQVMQSLIDYEVWGLIQDGHCQAALCVRPVDQDFEILWVQTRPDFQKLGFASQLMGAWLDFASQHDCRVFLEVHEKNLEAQGLYHKFKFEKLGIRKNYYKDGSSAISYQLDLTNVKRPS